MSGVPGWRDVLSDDGGLGCIGTSKYTCQNVNGAREVFTVHYVQSLSEIKHCKQWNPT